MKALPIIFGFALVHAWGISACGEPPRIRNLNGGKIDVIGHGGSGFQSPVNPHVENSSNSIYRALDVEGADGIEIDVRFTSDGVPVLFHDPELSSNTTCQGCISTTSSSDLAECRFRSGYFGNPLRGDTILALQHVIDTFARRRPLPKVYLDVKMHDDCDAGAITDMSPFARALEHIIRKHNAYSWIYVATGTHALAKELAGLDPHMKILMGSATFALAYRPALALKLYGIVVNKHEISAEEVALAHEKGLWVVLFDVKSHDGAVSAVTWHPDAIQTDRVRVLRAVLDP